MAKTWVRDGDDFLFKTLCHGRDFLEHFGCSKKLSQNV